MTSTRTGLIDGRSPFPAGVSYPGPAFSKRAKQSDCTVRRRSRGSQRTPGIAMNPAVDGWPRSLDSLRARGRVRGSLGLCGLLDLAVRGVKHRLDILTTDDGLVDHVVHRGLDVGPVHHVGTEPSILESCLDGVECLLLVGRHLSEGVTTDRRPGVLRCQDLLRLLRL